MHGVGRELDPVLQHRQDAAAQVTRNAASCMTCSSNPDVAPACPASWTWPPPHRATFDCNMWIGRDAPASWTLASCHPHSPYCVTSQQERSTLWFSRHAAAPLWAAAADDCTNHMSNLGGLALP